jgi:hypothetical protein
MASANEWTHALHMPAAFFVFKECRSALLLTGY